MSNVISLEERRQQIESQEKDEQLRIEKERRKRTRFVLSMDELAQLIQCFISYIEVQLDDIRMEMGGEEELKDNKAETKKALSILKRLYKKYISGNIADWMTLFLTYDDIYYSIVSLETGGFVDIIDQVNYEDMDKEQKIQLYLYHRLKEIDKKRLFTIDQTIFDFYHNRKEIPRWIHTKRLKIDNHWSIFCFKYNEEFHEKVELVEEYHFCLGATVIIKGYYVKKYPVEFRPMLNKLAKEGSAEYANLAHSQIEQEYIFQKGWRILSDGEAPIESVLSESPCEIEIVSFKERDYLEWEHENHACFLQERLWDLIDACINEDIVSIHYEL